MTTEQQPEEPQVDQQEEIQNEPQYYHSINRYWRGPSSPTRRIYHRSESCRIGGRIRRENRREGRRQDTPPCPVCCADEQPQKQDA